MNCHLLLCGFAVLQHCGLVYPPLMASPFSEFVPRYSLSHRALTYRRCLSLPERFPSRRRNGVRSDPCLRVEVLRARVCLSVEHHYTSGHMWVIDDDTDPVEQTLAGLGLEAVAARVVTLQAEAPCWLPSVLLAGFSPTQGAAPQRVAAAEADWLELGVSASLDGRRPALTLRLGRHADEIVLDHSFQHPARVRTLVPVAVPATVGDVRAHFGDDMAAAAVLLGEDRGRWFR